MPYTLSMTFIKDHKELSMSTSAFTSLQFTSHRTTLELKYQLQYTLNYYIWLSSVQVFIKSSLGSSEHNSLQIKYSDQ